MTPVTKYILENIKHAKIDPNEEEWIAAPCNVEQLEKLVDTMLIGLAVYSEYFGNVTVDTKAFIKGLKGRTIQRMLRIDYSEHTQLAIVREASYEDRKYFGNTMG